MGVALVLAAVLALAAPGRGALLRGLRGGVPGALGIAIVVVFIAWLPAVIGSAEIGRSLLMTR